MQGNARAAEKLTEVAARVHSQSDLGGIVIDIWSGLGAPKWGGVVGAADVELVVVPRESGETTGFDLKTFSMLRYMAMVSKLTLTV